uniref:Uncharacterized protein n=1 Tax=Picea glauca TaxID=3330 RepID=A0A124GP02_PICGL|nr:hypothetical protein ABT39_MTgene294 [Picea glauca]QHR90709.1 hypothetical protein Q903MT_gene4735 [Picea sitchensis]
MQRVLDLLLIPLLKLLLPPLSLLQVLQMDPKLELENRRLMLWVLIWT